MKNSPVVLIATTERWYPTARLGMGLANAGCVVHMVCPSGHPIAQTTAAEKVYEYSGLKPLGSFSRAIEKAQPDLLIPGDDLATQHLSTIHRQSRNATMRELIVRSLGPTELPLEYGRTKLIETAGSLGIRVPHTQAIRSADDLETWIDRYGFPVVLKADGTSGGVGVKIVRTPEEAEHGFRELQSPPLLARATKRAVVDDDATLIWPSILRQRPTINAQSFVTGHEATSAAFCWKGSVLASLHFEVVNKVHAGGHATVIRVIENPEMVTAVEKLARRLNLSGMYGFDFMIETTEHAYLVEMNPRATQVGHLSLGTGRDLPAAVYATLTGQPVNAAAKITDNDTIALFPQEWLREPRSAFLQSAYHDVPWEEPALVQHCIRKAENKNRRSLQTWVATPDLDSPRMRAAARLDCEID